MPRCVGTSFLVEDIHHRVICACCAVPSTASRLLCDAGTKTGGCILTSFLFEMPDLLALIAFLNKKQGASISVHEALASITSEHS